MNSPAQRNIPSRGTILLEFLGSMNLAITLLVTVAVASVVGTVLQQNQPYQDYIIKFGPFWHEVFKSLGLYDVYAAGWFLVILAFLVISTSVCIYRNAPNMVREMRQFRTRVQAVSLRNMHQVQEWHADVPVDALEPRYRAWLRQHGYKTRSADHDDHRLIAAKKGSWNRLGYIFTHTAIVVICLGGLVDGQLPVRVKEMLGQIQPETRDIPASQVPEISWLPEGNPSFRGNVTIPEGGRAGIAFLQLRDGYLVQPLPFTIELKDFRIEHYVTGQPKSFESDLVIHDPEREQPVEATIAVNHPLIYEGYAIYQASFDDGGSGLSLTAWPLSHPTLDTQKVETAVFESLEVETPAGRQTLEFESFRPFNVNPAPEDSDKQFQNFGPSFTYKLRNAQGEAREYENYMLPVELEGRKFFLSGVRENPNQPFFYLHIPADPAGSPQRFLAFNALLRDEARVREIAAETVRQTFSELRLQEPGMVEEVTATMGRLVRMFARGGFDGIVEQVEATVPEDRRMQVIDAYMKVLRNILSALYAEVLRAEGVDISEGISERDSRFYEDTLNAVTALPLYGSPFFLQLESFEQVQASGLQITRSPGKSVVYLGFTLLMIGVFMMFYVRQRRIWVWLQPQLDQTQVILAGSGERDRRDFEREFTQLYQGIRRAGESG